MRLNQFQIYIYFVILFFGLINSQVLDYLGHTYRVILFNGTSNWTLALNEAGNLVPGGYLATITKQAESIAITSFISQYYPTTRPFIAGSSFPDGRNFHWESGPEKNELFYNRDTNKAYGFANWSPNQPDRANPLTGLGSEFYVNLHPLVWNDYQINATSVLGFIVETGGSTDPFVAPFDTSDVEIIIKNVIGAQKVDLTVNVISNNGKKPSFTCPFYRWISNTSFSCRKLITMAGEYNITITDGSSGNYSKTIYLAHPSIPYVSSVIPSLVMGGLVTINGESFSDNITDLTAYISSSLVPCIPTKYLLPHRSFVCQLSADIYPTTTVNPNMAYITVGVNGIMLANRTRIPFYASATDRLVMQGGNFYYEIYNTYKYEGKTAVSYTPLFDYALLGRLENYQQCFETTYNSANSTYILTTTGQSLAKIYPATNTSECYASSFSGCGTLDLSTITNISVPLGYLASTKIFSSSNSKICKLTYKLDLPNYNPSLTENPKIYLVPTYGGRVNIPVDGLRLTSSNYTMTQGTVKFPQTMNPNWDTMSLYFDVPSKAPGSSKFYLAQGYITVYVDGKSSGLTESYVAYSPPVIDLMNPSNPPTQGGLLTLVGESFGANEVDISIEIIFSDTTLDIEDFTLLSPHEKISFTMPPGSGYFDIQVSVDGQVATYQTSYQPPSIIDISQDEKQLYLTVENIDSNIELITVTLNSENLQFQYINDSFLSITLLDTSIDGTIVLTVNGQSDSMDITLTPIISTIQNAQTGATTLINGFFLYQPSEILIGEDQCLSIIPISSNQVSCVPNGEGLNLVTTVQLTNTKISNIIEFSYGPVLTSVTNVNNTITIVGKNFDTTSNINMMLNGTSSYSFIPDSVTIYEIVATIQDTQVNTMISVASLNMSSESTYLSLVPVVKSVSSVSTLGGQIQIIGSYLNFVNYLSVSTSPVVQIGSSIFCNNLTLDQGSNQKLLCNVNAGTGSNLPVKITIDGVSSNTNILFSYGKPSITDYQQIDKELLIIGANFGNEISDVQATLNSLDMECSFYNESIKCQLTQEMTGGLLTVLISGQSTEINVLLTPIIESITPTTSESTTITIFGWFLRSNQLITDFGGDIGNSSCSSVNSFSDRNYVVCNLENSNSLKSESTPQISITIEEKQSNTIPFEFSEPSIVSVTQNGTSITIIGNTFGNLNSLPDVKLGEITIDDCEFLEIQNELLCTLPHSSISANVNITNYQGSSYLYGFIITPILTSISSVSTTGGETEITGQLMNDLLQKLKVYEIVINDVISCSNPSSTSNSIKCDIPDQLPVNSTVKIIVQTSITTNSLVFNYLPPSVVSFSQNSFELEIQGDNFGYDSLDNIQIESSNSQIVECLITENHVTITCDLSDHVDLLNGNFTVSRNSIKSSPFTLNFKPIITSTSLTVDPKGSTITIQGDFLNSLNSKGSLNTIKVNQGNFIKSIDSKHMVVNINSGSHGMNNQLSIEINNLSSNVVNYESSNPNLLEVLTNGKLYYPGKGGVVTIKGSNFIQQNELINVSIGGVECTSPQSKSFNEITCLFDASVEPNSTFALQVIVECDGLSTDGYLFLYSSSRDCSGDPQCSGKGYCYDGECVCNDDFVGSTCEIDGRNSTKPPDSVDPDGVNFKDFSVFFTHIREVDFSGDVVLIYPVSTLKWNITLNTTTQLQSIGYLENSALIRVNSTIYQSPQTISFAGELMKMSSNSLKYQIAIDNWSFKTPTNTIELIYSISSPSSQQICDESIESQQSIDNTTDIRTITVQFNGKVFSSQFSKRIISDNRVTISTTKLLPKTDSIFKDNFYINNSNLTVIALAAPSFKETTLIDPSFQYLIKTDFEKSETDCENTTKTKSLWWISLVVVGGVGSAAGATAFFIYRKKKLKANKFTSSLQSLN